ncbi:MAG: tRNA pseudouridine(38-40) synthase TruA [Bacteroidales bacterium]
MRYFIHLAYKGTNFHGWQKQPHDSSVQHCLETILSRILRTHISVVGAGRTDTGVHAENFYAHFDTNVSVDSFRVIHSLNTMLPHDIGVYRLFPVSDSLHARFSALSRTYRYVVSTVKNPFVYEHAMMLFHTLDIDAMNKACQVLFEFTDFTSFSKLHTDVNNNNCEIYVAYWEKFDSQYIFTISANRFLRNMVRAIVGTLLDVGMGKMSLAEFRSVIESRNRQNAGTSVDAKGLTLVDIAYTQEFDQYE